MNTDLGMPETPESPQAFLIEQHVIPTEDKTRTITTRPVGIALSKEDANKEVVRLQELFDKSAGHQRAQFNLGVTIRFGSRRLRLV